MDKTLQSTDLLKRKRNPVLYYNLEVQFGLSLYSFDMIPKLNWLLVTVVGWYRTKRPMHCDHFLIYCASPSQF
jgi:hypothetical protein